MWCCYTSVCFFFFKLKTAYEMRISDWSSDVCSSDLPTDVRPQPNDGEVESFSLWPMAEVLERLRDSDDFKFNVALVNLHFALRHGVLSPDSEPCYQQVVDGLAGRFDG